MAGDGEAQPTRLRSMKPGYLVAQQPKLVAKTEWSAAGVCLTFDDGSTYLGDPEEALDAVAPADQEG